MLITALMIFVSCNDERMPVEGKGNYGAITATLEQGSSKSRLVVQSDNSLEWSVGDVIKVFMSNGDTYDYKNTGEDTFVPVNSDQVIPDEISDEDVVGVLYEGSSSVNGSITNNKLETAFAQNVSVTSEDENDIHLPMWGTWNNGHISFKHLAGILRVKLANLPEGYDMLSLVASNPIAGTATVEDITEGTPVLDMDEDAEKLVSVKFTPTTSTSKDKTLYFPLPVGTYHSIEVVVSKSDETLAEGEFKDPLTLANWKNKTVERATIYTGSVAYTEVSSINDLNDVLSTNVSEDNKNAHVVVEEITANAGAVEVPEVINSNVTLDFSAVAKGVSTLEIKSNEGNDNGEVGKSEASIQNIVVNVGNDKNDTSVGLTLETPKATVQLEAGKFSTITATTAINTLIINGGVKIERLVIKGGNVLIEVGVEIDEIVNECNGLIDYIVRTESGLKTAFEYGGKYQLYEDIKITNKDGMKVGAGKSVVLDLNYKTITAEGDAFVVESDSKLVLNGNGYVKAGNTVGNWVAVWANGGEVIINDGKYSVGLDTDDSNSCIYAKNGGKVTINGGEFTHEIPASGNNYGMPLQVNNNTDGLITVNGGVFVLDDDRYYEAQDEKAGKIIINGDQVKDKDHKKIIVTSAYGSSIIIKNQELSDALYKLYGDVYYITIQPTGYAKMRESEVLAITELDFDAYEYQYKGSIKTLTGIENFVNLEILNCRNSAMTSCDLSKNVKLREFAVQGTQNLKSLDFSNNPNIMALYLNGNNGLESLNLDGCTQLGNLQLFGSALTSLNIPNKDAMFNLLFGGSLRLNPADFPNLTGLGCEYMELTDLEKFIPDKIKNRLGSLFCEGNKLTNLDLSKYPNLQFLYCSGNEITTLDLSKTPNMVGLACSGNKIETLDISSCSGLNSLTCGWQDNTNLTLQLTLNQKAILVDNSAYFIPEQENVALEIVVKNESDLKKAVEAGYNVKFGASFAISSAVVVANTLTVDLNGKTLTSAGDGFEVTAGTLTIEGDGIVKAGTVGDTWVAVWANGGNAVIDDGTFSVVEGKDGSTNDCIYAKGGQITINGGTFSNVGTYVANMGGVVINANNTVANSKVVINGGTFNPASGCVTWEQADVVAGRIELKLNNN